MNFEKLLDNKKIEQVKKTDCSLEQPLKDLQFAKDGLKTKNYNRIMAIAYEAVLMAGNELMNYLGYRAIGKEHYKNTFEFLKEIEINQELVGYFNKIRIKRNNFIYRGTDEIGEGEAKEIIKKAETLVQEIRTFVHKNRTKNNQTKKDKKEAA